MGDERSTESLSANRDALGDGLGAREEVYITVHYDKDQIPLVCVTISKPNTMLPYFCENHAI